MYKSNKKYCSYCGADLKGNVNFCSNCGEAVNESSKSYSADDGKRRVVYEGTVYKCPNCEYVLESFMTKCPACNYEIRDRKTTNSIKDFTLKLNEIDEREMPTVEEKSSIMKAIFGADFGGTVDKNALNADFNRQKLKDKIEFIKNYPIPNANEDILEFMIIISSNIDVKKIHTDELTKTWLLKFEQVYKKAELAMTKDTDYKKVKKLYDSKKEEINKLVKTNKTIIIVCTILICIFIGLIINTIGMIKICICLTAFIMAGRILIKNKRKGSSK